MHLLYEGVVKQLAGLWFGGATSDEFFIGECCKQVLLIEPGTEDNLQTIAQRLEAYKVPHNMTSPPNAWVKGYKSWKGNCLLMWR